MSDDPITAAGDDVKQKTHGVFGYVKAHWKELLALTLAAIPAFFILFHAGARKAAQSVLTLQQPGDASASGADPGTAIAPASSGSPVAAAAGAAAGAASSAAGAVAKTVKTAANGKPAKTSVNGHNTTVVAVPRKAPTPKAPPKKVVPATPTTAYRAPTSIDVKRGGPKSL